MKQDVQRATQPRMAASLRWLGIALATVLLLAAGVFLRPLLLPQEAVPVGRQDVERVAAWVFSKKGRVMVRSGMGSITATPSAELPSGQLVIERLLFTGIKEPNLTITDAELALWLPLVPDLQHFIVETRRSCCETWVSVV